jgi:propanol-preferring alcohol dehydrogenase
MPVLHVVYLPLSKSRTHSNIESDRCLAGGETCCNSTKISGYFTPGTFQQYCVTSATYATPIPETVTDLAGAAPLMCGGITVYAALIRAHVQPGHWVLVSGAGGGLGHLAIQYGRAFGVRVLALDFGRKESFCKGLGAEVFIDFTKFKDHGALKEEVHKFTGGGAKAVIMCASSETAYAQAVGWRGFRGTLVCLGVPEGERSSIAGEESHCGRGVRLRERSPIAGAVVEDLIRLELTIFGKLLRSV